jgi:hypothetical protein
MRPGGLHAEEQIQGGSDYSDLETGLKREPTVNDQTPNVLGFQLANTWPKITARGVYGMVRNGKECENP